MNPLTVRHLDGPRLIAWLYEREAIRPVNLKHQVGDRWSSQVNRWKKGSAIHVYTADKFLMSLGVALGEVPDEIYCEDPSRGSFPLTSNERASVFELYMDGLTTYAIGKKLGRNHKTVRRQLEKAGIDV